MEKFTFIILGATGDLTKRKLIPAIYRLIKEKKIKKFALIGAARTKTTSTQILNTAQKFITKVNPEVWKQLEESSHYIPLDFYDPNSFAELNELLTQIEKTNKLPGNRIFYLATLPEHFETITKHLANSKLVSKKQKPWTRIIYEKPFGHNLKSARKINRCVTKLFRTTSSSESQIYRIDHYLWEELVGNITLVRFANLFFEALWSNKYIESVQIILNETLGVESRGGFYDKYGALRDVVQNHILQMLALIAMEPPKKLSGEYIRDEKAKVLKKLSCKDVVLGQYKGYLKERGIAPKSTTETFAALKLEINNKRWKGVPFFIKTGKALPKKETSIHIKFKKPVCLKEALDCPMQSNYLSIQIQPREGFFLEVNTQIPGNRYQVTPAKMDFCHPCYFGPNTPQAYEVLLEDVLEGDQSVFVRFDEIEASWKLIDKILSKKHTIHRYAKGSIGPKEIESFAKKHKMRWRA